MDYHKFNRRARSARWATEYRGRAKTYRSASRAAALIYALANWLNNNAPSTVTGYTKSD